MKSLIRVVLFVLMIPAALASQEQQFALVFGNAKYSDGIPALANPVNDAQDVADLLTQLGWKVTLVTDGNRRDMNRAIATFGDVLNGNKGSSALFYYAGHGVQVGGKNYLLPIAEPFESENDVLDSAVDVDRIASAFVAGQARNTLMILDACRDNPFLQGKTRSTGVTRGLARAPAVEVKGSKGGSVTIFATAAGDTAQDGDGRNGLFTQVLLQELGSGKNVAELFDAVSSEVQEQSDGKQSPYINYGGSVKDFYISAKLDTTVAKTTKTAKGAAPAPSVGTVEFRSAAAGLVYLGDQLVGQIGPGLSLKSQSIPTGKQSFRLVPDDESEVVEKVVVVTTLGQSVLDFAGSIGSLTDKVTLMVDGPESGLLVIIDGKESGATPFRKVIPRQSSYQIQIASRDWEDFTTTVADEQKDVVRVQATMFHSDAWRQKAAVARADLLSRRRVVLSQKRPHTGSLAPLSWLVTLVGGGTAFAAAKVSESELERYKTLDDPAALKSSHQTMNILNTTYKIGTVVGLSGLAAALLFFVVDVVPDNEDLAIQDIDRQLALLNN